MFTRVLKLKLAAMMLAWLAALFVVAWLVFAGRQAALERGQDATVAFAAVVEQQVARTFQAANLTVGAIGDAHRLTPRPGKHDREFQEMMSRRLKDVPFIRAVFIIGPDGRIIHDTDHPATPAVSLADRVYSVPTRPIRREGPRCGRRSGAARAWGSSCRSRTRWASTAASKA
jgi:two-component system, NtrC family, sensor kinase